MQKPDVERVTLRMESIWNGTEERIMQDIVRRIKKTGEITSTADYQINQLVKMGKSTEEVEQMLKEALDATYPEMYELYDQVANWQYVRNKDIYEQVNGEFIPPEENDWLIQISEAVKKQTKDELENLAQSYGFTVMVGNKRVFTPFAQYYQKYVDTAIMDIVSGGFDYNTVIRRVVTQMTNSGLRTVDYASGYSNRTPVAVRRAIMTGISQITGKVNERNAALLGTDYYEVSWHASARPTHREWQGKVYSYKELEDICGLGSGDGLCGWNCYHEYYPFIPGISQRLYTDEWLEAQNRKEDQKKSWMGKEYNAYEQTQKQRQMETSMRAQRQKVDLLKEAGASKEEITLARAKYQAQLDEYSRFCKKMGIKEQRERIYMDGRGRVAPITSKSKKMVFSSISDNSSSYNPNAKFNLAISNVSEEINKKVNELCSDVIKKGNIDGFEHGYTIDIKSGESIYYTSGEAGEVFGRDFFDYLSQKDSKSIISIHNHADNRGFSYTDINTYVTQDALYANIAACHNGKVYLVEDNIKQFETGTSFTDADLFTDIVDQLRVDMKNGNITIAEFSSQKEEKCCEEMAKAYFRKYEVIE